LQVQGLACYNKEKSELLKYYPAAWSTAQGNAEFTAPPIRFAEAVSERLATSNAVARIEYKLFADKYSKAQKFGTLEAFTGAFNSAPKPMTDEEIDFGPTRLEQLQAEVQTLKEKMDTIIAKND
jgi:hypothetical protein